MPLQPVSSVSVTLGGTLPPPPGQALLSTADFAYLGHYDVPGTVATNSSQGLTHRYVGGELRLMTLQGSTIRELLLAGKSYGQALALGRTWAGIGGFAVSGDYKAIWWEEARQRLWTNAARSYTSVVQPTQIYTRTLNDDGTTANLRGPMTLNGKHDRRVFGGAKAVPAWFQQQYGVDAYVVGWGGGTSLIMNGGGASCGPVMYTLPDPDAYQPNVAIPTRTLMDFAPANQRRGARITVPINYMDGGDPRGSNASTPPTTPPGPGQLFPSPRPDGRSWWTACDSYWGTINWIDLPDKRGVVAVLSAWSDKVYYMSSDVHCDNMKFELHVFDPATLGEVAAGTRQPHQVEPASMVEVLLPGLTNQGHKTHMTPGASISGATFDPIGRRLYLFGAGIHAFTATSRVYVFQV